MYRYLLIILVVILCGFSAINDTDKIVMAAAESQLPVFLSKIPAGQEGWYGFKESDDLELGAVGKPYRLLFFTPDFYRQQIVEDKNYLVIKNEWRVPVIFDGDYRTLLTITGNPGNYIISGLGDTVLAKELQQQSAGSNDNSEFYVLRIPQLRADFFVTEHDNSFSEARFVPLLNAIVAIPSLSSTSKQSFSLMEVEKAVKEALGKTRKLSGK